MTWVDASTVLPTEIEVSTEALPGTHSSWHSSHLTLALSVQGPDVWLVEISIGTKSITDPE